MPKQIDAALMQAILAAKKNPNKLAVELKVHVFSCPSGGEHAHFSVTSPYVENRELSRKIEDDLMVRATSQNFQPKNGDYIFRQSLVDGTKCLNIESLDVDSVNFLLEFGVTTLLFNLSKHLHGALMQWPTDTVIEQYLAREYSETLRRKIWFGTDARPIRVEVMGAVEDEILNAYAKIDQLFFGHLPRPSQNDKIVLVAFSDDNPCALVVRKVLAAYATEILTNKVEPEIAPKVVERVQLALDTLATHLAKQQASETESTTTAPTATSGDVAGDLIEEGVAPAVEGHSLLIGATA